ncbi:MULTISPECIES: ATP-binding protein [unclassified Bradyrhizobium]|uniref:ATP-binding protein n=1 Tax=unclassified Bradyrhizobium TaxID=2631580 RepID=UPI00351157A5
MAKDHRRIEMALKLAHFPAVKELAGFDFEAQPSIDPKQIRDLAASRWIANANSRIDQALRSDCPLITEKKMPTEQRDGTFRPLLPPDQSYARRSSFWIKQRGRSRATATAQPGTSARLRSCTPR